MKILYQTTPNYPGSRNFNPSGKRTLDGLCIDAQLGEGKSYLEKLGYRIPSLEESALFMIERGKTSKLPKHGHWAKEAFLYVPYDGFYITKNSPILDNLGKAIEAEAQDESYALSIDEVESARQNAVQIPNKKIFIPTRSFKENGITNFIFGKYAENFGLLLDDVGIKNMPINPQEMDLHGERLELLGPCAEQIWFEDFYRECKIHGARVSGSYAVLGVKKNTFGMNKPTISSPQNIVPKSVDLSKTSYVEKKPEQEKPQALSRDDKLKRELDKAIEKEDYEHAAWLRDEINGINSNKAVSNN
ncbi:MAG: UvrB/UvrC motif-containing protein [Nanoarchaeota archaeon]